jgi:hypothetical protein
MENAIQKYEVSEETLLDFLKSFGGTKLTDVEKIRFINIAKAFGLNPFKREIHLAKYGEETSIIVGYEVYIKRAEATGKLKYWNVGTKGTLKKTLKKVNKKDYKTGKFYEKEITVYEGDLIAYIDIERSDWDKPFHHEVVFTEYYKENDFWGKPITMIKKVVTGQGFRLCFTEACGSLPYTDEERQIIEAEAVPIEERIEPSEIQKEALELLETAVFNGPESYNVTKTNIMKDDQTAVKAIIYLRKKQPKPESIDIQDAEIVEEKIDNLELDRQIIAKESQTSLFNEQSKEETK